VKTLTPVFIAYDRRDRSFVRLLHKLLEHEGIESWFDRERNAAGDSNQKRVANKLAQARSMIVVVSEHALDSARVRAELTEFRARNRECAIIPITLDATPPARLDAALAACDAVPMQEDMLAGLVELFACFSRGFLSGQRRAQGNRRLTPDRRGSIIRRLRVGLWQQFAHATGLGKFDTVDVTRYSATKFAAALHVELSKYELYDEAKRQVDARWALSQAFEACETPSETKAIYLVEKLASYLHSRFEVRSRDRRDLARRNESSAQRNAQEVGIEL
jgi:TIR domain